MITKTLLHVSVRFPKPQKFDEIFSTNLQEPSMEPPCWEFKGPSDFDIDINNLQTIQARNKIPRHYASEKLS